MDADRGVPNLPQSTAQADEQKLADDTATQTRIQTSLVTLGKYTREVTSKPET
jgi:hypothetical protein